MLTAAGVLARPEYHDIFPPTVVYRLTPAARSAVEAMRPVAAWARDHPNIIGRAQHDKRTQLGPAPLPGPVTGHTEGPERAG